MNENLNEICIVDEDSFVELYLFEIIIQCPNLTKITKGSDIFHTTCEFLMEMNSLNHEIQQLYCQPISSLSKFMNLNFYFKNEKKRKYKDI